MKRGWILAGAAAAALLAMSPAAKAQTAQEAARKIVQAQGYASLEPVPRGRTFEVAVVAEIKPTYHINAHKVLDEYLIPTMLAAQAPAGFRVLGIDYPAGELRQFSFSKNKLAVYTGKVILKMKVETGAQAALGTEELPLSFRYQACNDTMCLPPVKIPVDVRLTVAKAGAPAKAVHSELFR